MTRRRFIADTWTDTTATLTGDQAVHLARVLRAKPGQVYDIVANGFLHRAEITEVNDDRVHFQLHEELESDAALPPFISSSPSSSSITWSGPSKRLPN